MANSPTSYLHTLAKDEAIAFVASLQKVKEHLSQELHWISVQAHQKTTQLQGIETLLSEALALGLIDSKALSVTKPSSAPTDDFAPAVANGSRAAVIPSIAPSTITTPTTPAPSTRQKRGSQSPKAAKAPRGSKPSAAKSSVPSKTSTAPTKQSSRSTAATSKARSSKSVGLQQFLQKPYRDKSLTDSVSQILALTSKPLSADDIMAKLYDGLSSGDYKRAKNSVTNILSVGRSKGKWKSTSRGLYAGNAVASSKG